MESKFTKAIILIATISAAIFAGIQTFSSSGLFSLKQIQYDYITINTPDDFTGTISDVTVSINDGDTTIPLKKPVFFDILIQNTGDIDIPKTDFEGSIKFTFDGSKPLRVQQVSSSTDSLTTSPEISGNNVLIPPILLNSEDYFVIRVLLDGTPTKIKPHLRFLGMDTKFELMPEKTKFNKIDYISISMVFIAFIVMGRLASILFLGIALLKHDLTIVFFTIYILGLLLAKQTGHLSGFGATTEFLFLFTPAIVAGFCSWLIASNTSSASK